MSPSDTAYNVDRKVRAYLRAGVTEVWIIYSEGQHMYVHTKAGPRALESSDILDTPVIPGWSIAVGRLFEL